MRDIKGYEGQYAVTEDGRVWSYPRVIISKNHVYRDWSGGFLRHGIGNRGYHHVTLSNGKTKTRLIHRLVAEAFIPNPLGLAQVNHKNGNKNDNRVENLEWMTLQENMTHAAMMGLKPRGARHHMAKLNETKVVSIRKLARRGVSHTQLASEFGVGRTNIVKIVNRQIWKHL